MQLSDIISDNHQVRLMSYPYNYAIIENFFNAAIYQEFVEQFNALISDARILGQVGDHTEHYYNAYTKTPPIEAMSTDPMRYLVSKELQTYLCGFFGSKVNDTIAFALHSHPPPSKAGWKHTDFNVVRFNTTTGKIDDASLRMWVNGSSDYADDTAEKEEPNTTRFVRHMACIYYLNNPDWSPNHGGETGIFSAYEKDIPLVAKVPPINNSLFFFEATPYSYHAFVGSQVIRNSFIWWYHTSPAYALKKNQEGVKNKPQPLVGDGFEYWTAPDKSKWSVRNDPEYHRYF
jgi:hypothetical protein